MGQHGRAARAADEGLGPRVRHQHGEQLPQKAVAGDAAITNADGQGVLLLRAVLHGKSGGRDLLHGAKPGEKGAHGPTTETPMESGVSDGSVIPARLLEGHRRKTLESLWLLALEEELSGDNDTAWFPKARDIP